MTTTAKSLRDTQVDLEDDIPQNSTSLPTGKLRFEVGLGMSPFLDSQTQLSAPSGD